ncbi:MAG TPA: hypothetical protein VJN18_06835 [Polyangiaceae bacterium]|nr:hypothetical protein [Polyangiaceae bacterium]
MSQPATHPQKLRRFQLSKQELALLKQGPLSVEDSRRMCEYLEGDTQDPEIEAWMANPVGPVPWPETRS